MDNTSFENTEFTTAGFDIYPWPTGQESVASEFDMFTQSGQGFSNPCEATICVTFDLAPIPDAINDGTVHKLTPRSFPVSNSFTIRNINKCVGTKPRSPFIINNSPIRRRRPSIVLTGNNRHGNRGKLRCEQCRAWKQKCHYDEAASPCTYCVGKGLSCGPKIPAKDWRLHQNLKSQASGITPIRRIPGISHVSVTPEDDLPLPFEETHIRSIRERNFLFTFTLLQFPRTDGHFLWENVFRRFGPVLSSKPVRYGCILYSIYKHLYEFKQGNSLSPHTVLIYLNYFYQATREAINRDAFSDVAYGCFAVCMYGLRSGSDFEEIAKHARGFRLSVERLMETCCPIGEEMFFFECMWEKLIWVMGEKMLFKMTSTTDVLDKIASFAYPLSLSDYRNQPKWVQESFTVVKLKFQFLRFIIAIEYQCDAESIRLKNFLISEFCKSWRASPQTHRDQTTLSPCCDRTLLRKLSAQLWSELLELLAVCGVVGDAAQHFCAGRTTIEIISSIHSIVDLVPEAESVAWLPMELWHLVDLTIYCLTFVGLVISEAQLTDPSGSSFDKRE